MHFFTLCYAGGNQNDKKGIRFAGNQSNNKIQTQKIQSIS
jgi:hypothetical protein